MGFDSTDDDFLRWFYFTGDKQLSVEVIFNINNKVSVQKTFGSPERTGEGPAEEEVYATMTSGGGTVNTKKDKKATVSSNSTTMDLKEKKIRATFIKYK